MSWFSNIGKAISNVTNNIGSALGNITKSVTSVVKNTGLEKVVSSIPVVGTVYSGLDVANSLINSDTVDKVVNEVSSTVQKSVDVVSETVKNVDNKTVSTNTINEVSSTSDNSNLKKLIFVGGGALLLIKILS